MTTQSKTTQHGEAGSRQAQHTPGPWRVGDVERCETDLIFGPIATVPGVVTGWEIVGRAHGTNGRKEANARLLAAAPDMLEAGDAVVRNAITGEAPSGFALVRLEDFSALSAAIAKAQGAQP